MNHSPAFQALWARLRKEVRQLQDKGYYGDGHFTSLFTTIFISLFQQVTGRQELALLTLRVYLGTG